MTVAQKAGMSAARLGRIRPAVEQHIGPEKLAGAMTFVARRGRVVHFEAYGQADREASRPMTPDTIVRLYSMTKPITMVALLALAEEGRVRLTDPVHRFIPEFQRLRVVEDETSPEPKLRDLARPVTVRDLMTHTSGLTYHFNENGAVDRMYREAGLFDEEPLSSFVERIASMPLAFQPGTAWRYSCGHDVVARIVEVASGKSYGDYLEERLFAPLRMVDTGFFVPEVKLGRLAAEYGLHDIRDPAMTGTKWTGLDGSSPRPRLLRGPHEGLEASPHGICRGGHGLLSTAEDYYRFCAMLLGGGALDGERILSRKTVELMTSNHLRPELLLPPWGMPGYGFGLGVAVMTDPAQAQRPGSVGEHEWGGAAGTSYWVDPAEELIGILMVQFQPGGSFGEAQDFRMAAYQAIDD